MKPTRLLATATAALTMAVWLCSHSPGFAADTESVVRGLKVVSLRAWPPAVELAEKFAYRQLLLTGKLATGESVDLTRLAKLAQPSELVSISPARLVRPAAAGAGQLVFTYAGLSVTVPVKVSGLDQKREVSFVRDVTPALSKMGCSAGTCHGSKAGKAGFKLSLRSYDVVYDHRALTDDIAARRINRAAPEQSLMLLKSSGGIPHVGGVLATAGQPYYELLRTWIADGVKLDLDSPRVTKIEVFPDSPIMPLPKMKQQMAVLATYSDGSVRDVSAEAFIESGNIEVTETDDHGVVTTLRRGEAAVLARYEGAYAATTITVMGDRSGFVWKQLPVNNYIDELADQKLQRVKVLPSGLCSDADFIRRASVDLTGMLPMADEVRAFLADQRPTKEKRDALVDKLVGGGPYVEHWTNKWADLLQVNRKFLGEQGAFAFRNWIKHAVSTNMPYDQFVYQIITSRGSNIENPAASYYKILRDPAEAMESTTHLFLGVRFSCNKCHDHPFERWTQSQYYHLAAYFSQVGRKEDPAFAGQKVGGTAVEGAKPLIEVIYDTGTGEVKHLLTGQVAQPQVPYQSDLVGDSPTRRQQLARWIVSPQNQYFARSYVNRLWGYLFGVGIIEPIDDIRAGNPPTNARLLDTMTEYFINSGFDAQQVLRTICKSRTYQLSVVTNKWNEDDDINYSHAMPRRLSAEVLYDAIHRATGSTSNLPGIPAGLRAAELPDVGVRIPFLDDFGRPARESPCECERSTGMVLGPVMKLVNGPTVARAIADPDSELSKLVAREQDDAKLLEELFLRFLARPPSQDEVKIGRQAMRAAAEDLKKVAAQLQAYENTLPAKQAAWEKSLGTPVLWTVVDPIQLQSSAGATLTRQQDKSVLVSGKNGKGSYTIIAPTDLRNITGLRLEVLADEKLPKKGPGRAQNGNFVLSQLKFTAAASGDLSQSVRGSLQNAKSDFSQQKYEIVKAIDGSAGSGWAIHPQVGTNHTAVFELKENIGFEGGTMLSFVLSHQHDETHALGRFRLSITTSPRPVRLNYPLPENLARIVATPLKKRAPEARTQLAKHFRSLDPELARLTAELAQAAEQANNQRLAGVQDLAWALINSPAFLFNR